MSEIEGRPEPTPMAAPFHMEPTSPGAPTNQQVAHALHFAYTAWFSNKLDVLHPFDRDVIQKVAAWTVGKG